MSPIPIISSTYCYSYIFIFFVLFLSCIPLSGKNYFSERNTVYGFFKEFFLFFLLILFIGFRGYVITDFVNYQKFYNELPSLFSNSDIFNKFSNNYGGWEKGFKIFAIFCKTLGLNYFNFQTVSFLIDYIIISYLFKYYSINKPMGFCFFILFSGITIEFNLLRNSKSIALFLLSIQFLNEKRYIKYILLNLLGFMFHTTGIIYLFVGFFLPIKISKKILYIILCLGVLIFVLRIPVLLSFLNLLGDFIPGRLGLLIRFYIQKNTDTTAFSIGFIERVATILLLLKYYNFYYKDRKNCIVGNSIVIYVTTYLFGYELPIVYERIGCLFAFSYWFFYPRLYYLLNKAWKNIFLVVCCLYGILKLYSGYRYSIFFWDSYLSMNMLDYDERVKIVHYFQIFEANR